MCRKIQYAWVNAAVCCVLYFFCSGIAVTGFSIYMPYVKEANNFTHTQLAQIIMVRSLFGLVSKIWVLWLIKKIEIRRTTALACLSVAIAFFLYGVSTTLSGFFVAAVFAGIGYGMGSSMAGSVLLHRWFDKNFDIAIGLAASGAGLSVLIWPTVATNLILMWDLERAFLAIAVLAVFGSVVIFLFLRDYPKQSGLEPVPEIKNVKSGGFRADNSFYLAPLLLGMIVLNCNSVYPLYFVECGYNSMTVAYAISLCGAALLIGKISYGFIANHIGNKRTSSMFISFLICGFFLGGFATWGMAILYLSAIFCGCGVALTTVGMPVWISEFVPYDEFDEVTKRVQIIFALGGFIFSMAPGMLADLLGGYSIVYLIFIIFASAVLMVIRRIYRIKSRQG